MDSYTNIQAGEDRIKSSQRIFQSFHKTATFFFFQKKSKQISWNCWISMWDLWDFPASILNKTVNPFFYNTAQKSVKTYQLCNYFWKARIQFFSCWGVTLWPDFSIAICIFKLLRIHLLCLYSWTSASGTLEGQSKSQPCKLPADQKKIMKARTRVGSILSGNNFHAKV